MTRRRPIDEHLEAVRALDGRLVDQPTRLVWCPHHDQPTPCRACAGDHQAGEHHSLPALPTCPRCRPIPAQHTTHADRSAQP